MDTDEKYDRIISLLEGIEAKLSALMQFLEKYKGLLARVEQRFQGRWGRS